MYNINFKIKDEKDEILEDGFETFEVSNLSDAIRIASVMLELPKEAIKIEMTINPIVFKRKR